MPVSTRYRDAAGIVHQEEVDSGPCDTYWHVMSLMFGQLNPTFYVEDLVTCFECLARQAHGARAPW